MPPPSRKNEVLALLPPAEAVDWPLGRLGKLGTVAHIVGRVDFNEQNVNRYLKQLRAAGLCRIGRWHRTAGRPAAVWVLGVGPDEPMPAPRTQAEYSRKHRRRVKKAIATARRGGQFNERYADKVGIALAYDNARSTRAKPQGIFAALGI